MTDHAATTTRSRTQIATLAGAATIVLGSLLPWATARTVLGQVSYPGLEVGGTLTLMLAGAIAVAAWLRHGQRRWHAGILAGVGLVLTFGVLRVLTIGRLADEHGSEYATINVGGGLYLVLLGAALAGGATVMAMSSRSS